MLFHVCNGSCYVFDVSVWFVNADGRKTGLRYRCGWLRDSTTGDALELEFAKSGIPYVREDDLRVYYEGVPLKTHYRADFTCFGRQYIVELKAIKTITKIEWAQVVHYMRATGTPYGLLVNFGRPQLQYDTFDKESLPKIFNEERRSGGNILQIKEHA